MKNVFILLISTFLLIACSTTKNTPKKAYKKTDTSEHSKMYHFADKLTDAQLKFIKNQYNWKDEKILIINYNMPMDDCHFDNSTISVESEDWWKKFYKDVDTEDCLNIKVLYHGERVKNKLDNITYFDDKENYLYDNFFNRKKSCFGILVINDQGDYFQYNGHYSENQVTLLLFSLRNEF